MGITTAEGISRLRMSLASSAVTASARTFASIGELDFTVTSIKTVSGRTAADVALARSSGRMFTRASRQPGARDRREAQAERNCGHAAE